MSIPFSAGTAFTTATCVNAWIEYPFANNGDSATKVYHHTMQVERLSYAPLAFNDTMTAADEKPTRSPFPDDANAYWIEDSTPSDIGGTLVEFRRTFANIPADRFEGNGSYSFTFPGNSSLSFKTLATSTGAESATYDSATNEGVMTFNVATADLPNFTKGVTILVKNNASGSNQFQVKINGTFTNTTLWNCYIADVSGNTITARVDLDQFNGTDFRSSVTITTFTAEFYLWIRTPESKNANSKTKYTYIKTDDISELTGSNKFEVIDTSPQSIVDTLSATTSPSQVGYINLIIIGKFIQAEATSVNRWRGNIWEVANVLVQAQ